MPPEWPKGPRLRGYADRVTLAELDFYSTIKLVNYVRSSVKSGNTTPDTSRVELFADDEYLQPVIEDDSLLFSLDDVLDQANGSTTQTALEEHDKVAESSTNDALAARIAELEAQLSRLGSDFTSYKELVAHTLDSRWKSNINDQTSSIPEPSQAAAVPQNSSSDVPTDTDYFTSYASPAIHETMLKDTVRTNAYRDFIYGHKSLFLNKTVLDVGCGTGILSFFAARAGATKVHAVDNSDIIARAREIAAVNDLTNTVSFHRGKIEELHDSTPALASARGQIDILVSEWMGYALLYEAMLDSVIAARDLYLKPPSDGGLMVPSHCTLHLAACSDPDFISDTVSFWHEVYAFNFQPMITHPSFHADAIVRDVPSRALIAPPALVKTFPLQHIHVTDLSFTTPFALTISSEADKLDGFALWFDAFFLPPPHNLRTELPSDVDGGQWKGPGVAFTTGPAGRELTHWQTVWLGVNRVGGRERPGEDGGGKRASTEKAPQPTKLEPGMRVHGTLSYRKLNPHSGSSRELEIELEWRVVSPYTDHAHAHDSEGGEVLERGRQVWFMR